VRQREQLCGPGGFPGDSTSLVVFQNRLTNEVGQALPSTQPGDGKRHICCNAARYLPVMDPATGTRDTLPSNLQGMASWTWRACLMEPGALYRDESSPRAI